MRYSLTHLLKLLFLSVVFILTNAIAVDVIPNGKALTQKYCSECHGEKGNVTAQSNGNIPNIAGFSSLLIYDTLFQFKEGDRQSTPIKNSKGKLTDMKKISKSLSEEETESIAFYIAEQTFVPAKQSYDKALVVTGKQLHIDLCNDCHGDNGKSALDDAPILAGQWKPYLIKQFDQISNRERYVPRRMKRKFRKLNKDDKEALIAFYTSANDTNTQ
jgi:sulfide dehydrogenase cytochrome subunit